MNPNVLEVGPGVHYVEASHTNFVLIVDRDAVTLVDSGYPGDRELVAASLQQLNRRLTDLSAVLLTHAHSDHIGSAEWLRETYSVAVHCHAEEAAHARGEVDEVITLTDVLPQMWRPGVLPWMANAVAKGGLAAERLAEVRTFADNDVIDVPGRPAAVHTPGHTTGHCGFHLPNRGVLISGDEIITVDVWKRSRRGPQLIRPIFNLDHDRVIASLSRYEHLDAEVVVPGHGRPYRGTPAQAVAEARRDVS